MGYKNYKLGLYKLTFGSHGTFYLRDGWIAKILDEVNKNPYVFSDVDAAIKLGVGHNMVGSMKFWSSATGICSNKKIKNKFAFELTQFGKLILKSDPYLERIESLWLLHFNLVKNKRHTSTWYWIFNKLNQEYLETSHFPHYISSWISQNYKSLGISKPEVAKNTLKKDIRCFIQTYTKSTKGLDPEDNLISPLSRLNLIHETPNHILFNSINIHKIPITVFEYLFANYIQNHKGKEKQVNIRDLLIGENSPGRILRCSTNSLYQYILDMKERDTFDRISIDRTAGLDVITIKGDLDQNFILKKIYNDGGKESV